MTSFEGIYTALITPFHVDGSLDLEGLCYIIEEQIQAGVHGVIFFGSTGEGPTIEPFERTLITETVVQKFKGQIELIFVVTHASTAKAIELAELGESLGADAVMAAPPYYNKPTQEGIFLHYSAIASSIKIPLILYNHPFRTSVTLKLETIRRLMIHKNIVAMKDSSGTTEGLFEAGQYLNVLAGDDINFLPAMALGSKGLVSALSNLFPKTFVEIYNLCMNNNFHAARELYQELLPFVLSLNLETNPIVIKKLMELHQKPGGIPRLPLTEATSQTEQHLLHYVEKSLLCKS